MISQNRPDSPRGIALAVLITLIVQLAYVHPTCAAEFQPTRFDVTVKGSGPDVILIPGLASSGHVWDAEAGRLGGYRLHIVQVKGFAGLPAGANAEGPIILPLVEDLATYVKANGLKRPAVIGHSFGGLVGLMLAIKNPETVGRLMIVDSLPFVGLMFGPGATVTMVEPRAKMMRDKIIAESEAEYAASEPRVMAGLVKTRDRVASDTIAAAAASDHIVVARAMYEDLVTDLRPDLAAIKTPVTMLYPWDAATGMSQAMFDNLYQSAYAPLPHKTIVRINGSFHFIQIDQPEAFDREVQRFLARYSKIDSVRMP